MTFNIPCPFDVITKLVIGWFIVKFDQTVWAFHIYIYGKVSTKIVVHFIFTTISASRLRTEERIFVEIAQSAITKNASHKKLALRLTDVSLCLAFQKP